MTSTPPLPATRWPSCLTVPPYRSESGPSRTSLPPSWRPNASGDFGVHSEMFTTGLMRLHQAGKVTNARKGIYEGVSVTTFALGSAELYRWLDGNDAVAFLDVNVVNDPATIGQNRTTRIDQRCALGGSLRPGGGGQHRRTTDLRCRWPRGLRCRARRCVLTHTRSSVCAPRRWSVGGRCLGSREYCRQGPSCRPRATTSARWLPSTARQSLQASRFASGPMPWSRSPTRIIRRELRTAAEGLGGQ